MNTDGVRRIGRKPILELVWYFELWGMCSVHFLLYKTVFYVTEAACLSTSSKHLTWLAQKQQRCLREKCSSEERSSSKAEQGTAVLNVSVMGWHQRWVWFGGHCSCCPLWAVHHRALAGTQWICPVVARNISPALLVHFVQAFASHFRQ